MTPAENRVRIWKHNALLGAAAMADASMERVLKSDTTTDEAKALAASISIQLAVLKKLLKTRVD